MVACYSFDAERAHLFFFKDKFLNAISRLAWDHCLRNKRKSADDYFVKFAFKKLTVIRENTAIELLYVSH